MKFVSYEGRSAFVPIEVRTVLVEWQPIEWTGT